MYKKHYQHFLQARPGLLHCAPHSHYYWPDVTRAAQLQYWDDSAALADDKWAYLFTEKVPRVQAQIARLLQVPRADQVVFAPNTHELLYRLITAFPYGQPLRILTTDGEFHSFNRQSRRLLERGNVTLEQIPTEPFGTLADRWSQAVQQGGWDLIFISQVFFNSGVPAPAAESWVPLVQHPDTVVVIDGYHGFGALPTDLSSVSQRVFYLSGAYKYGQAGEGACFAIVPPATALRPEYTGWFADFANLAESQTGPVQYADNAMRFAGATIDLSGLYRLGAVLDWWEQDQLTCEVRHSYIQQLQRAFLARLDQLGHPELNRANLVVHDLASHGHFFTFRLSDQQRVRALAEQLRTGGVVTDFRENRLRFGFALYHEASDYAQISRALKS